MTIIISILRFSAVKLVPGGQAIGVSSEVLDLDNETQSVSCEESMDTVNDTFQNTPFSEENVTRCSSGQSSQISTEMSTAQGSTR